MTRRQWKAPSGRNAVREGKKREGGVKYEKEEHKEKRYAWEGLTMIEKNMKRRNLIVISAESFVSAE